MTKLIVILCLAGFESWRPMHNEGETFAFFAFSTFSSNSFFSMFTSNGRCPPPRHRRGPMHRGLLASVAVLGRSKCPVSEPGAAADGRWVRGSRQRVSTWRVGARQLQVEIQYPADLLAEHDFCEVGITVMTVILWKIY